MPRSVMLVFSDPVDRSREAEYNDWYQNVHLPEVLAVPGIVGAQRWAFSPEQRTPDVVPPTGHRYLTVYEIDGDDSSAETITARIAELTARGQITRSDAVGLEPPPVVAFFDAC